MNVLCTNCQHPAQVAFQVSDLNRHITAETFTYYRCPNCGLIFLSPIPANLGDYYQSDYYPIPASRAALAAAAEGQRYKIDAIRPLKARGKLLEIGASFGAFAYLAQEAGYDTEVIELDRDCCSFIEHTLGIPVFNSGDAATVLKDRGQYDVIALWQVIEHLPTLWALLPVLVQHLAPGGLLVVAAPNPDSLEFRLFGRYWAHLDAPRHLALIPLRTLEQATTRLGLQLVYQTTADREAQICNTYGWKMSLHHLTKIQSLKRPMRALGYALSLALMPIERHGLRGSTYTQIFQKNA